MITLNVMDDAETIGMDLREDAPIGLDIVMDAIEGVPKTSVEFNTTSGWNDRIMYIPEAGTLCVYTDHKTINGKVYYAVKVGDGKAYLADLPFIAEDIDYDFREHINDKVVHITDLERDKWNNKISCYMGADENLVFTTD